MNQFTLLKSHIDAYTRKDGVVVQAHDDSRVASSSGDQYGHPNVVGRAERAKGSGRIKWAGREFADNYKDGESQHDGTKTRNYREVKKDGSSGEDVWLDHKMRVHADSTSEVKRMRGQYEAHMAKRK
jgi:hypothetical protein